MTTEFVPVAIGWYGEFGPSFQGFMERVGSYCGDRSGSEKEMQFAAKWRTRRFAAAVQAKYHLSIYPPIPRVVPSRGLHTLVLSHDFIQLFVSAFCFKVQGFFWGV